MAVMAWIGWAIASVAVCGVAVMAIMHGYPWLALVALLCIPAITLGGKKKRAK